MPLSARQCVEFFHLVFLRALVAKGEDKALIALKGGCNLRFYFDSVRYSEDIDFDVSVIARDTLKNKVDRLLRSPLVQAPLKAKGIELTETSAPKQTDTTQRWKVGLRVQGLSVPLRTKVEFSRREAVDAAAFAAVRSEVLRPYGLTPMLANHYTTGAAIAQKVHALAGRAEPQARDIFDLNVLLARPDAAELKLEPAQRAWVPAATEHAMSISYDEYRAKVVAYLDPEQAVLFEERATWEHMQDTVVARLEALA
jgi:predicted nucleotidyltransferase component of viral defense system